jgi:hypothetical protein
MPGLAASDFNTSSKAGGAMGSWFFDKQQSGGGPLIDLGVHRLDLALWLMGYPEPAYVMGSTYAKFGPERAKAKGLEYTVEDLACAMIKFKNGATLELDASWASHVKNAKINTRVSSVQKPVCFTRMSMKAILTKSNFSRRKTESTSTANCTNPLRQCLLHSPSLRMPSVTIRTSS